MLDLPLKGNLGKEKEEGLILLIKNMKEAEILIDKNEIDMHYQESKKVREYVKNSMEKIGEIEEFEIYKQNKINIFFIRNNYIKYY